MGDRNHAKNCLRLSGFDIDSSKSDQPSSGYWATRPGKSANDFGESRYTRRLLALTHCIPEALPIANSTFLLEFLIELALILPVAGIRPNCRACLCIRSPRLLRKAYLHVLSTTSISIRAASQHLSLLI